jgi:hypothetical protein
MLKIFIQLNLVLLFSQEAIGSDYHWMRTFTKEWKNSYKSEYLEGRLGVEVLKSLDSLYSHIPNSYFFFYNGGELQSYISCGFDLYSIQGMKLKPKYNYFNRGYTCSSTPFVRDSINYLIAGHGFWTNHFDLLRFDEIHGSWEIIKTANQPLNYFTKGVFNNSKGVYALFGAKENLRTGLGEKVPNGYFLDWNTKEWKEIEINIDGVNNSKLVNNGKIEFLETKDYLYMVTISDLDIKQIGWNIIEKESGKIYFFDYLKNEDVFTSPFIEVIGNTINYQAPNGTPKSLNLEYLMSRSKEVGFISFKGESFDLAEVFPFKDRIYILSIIILLLFSINLYMRNRSEPNLKHANNFDEIEKVVESFTHYLGQLLNTEQLDEILGIDSLKNLDSKRLKRSRWINRLNEYNNSKNGTDLIVRDKNPDDKRYIYYRING